MNKIMEKKFSITDLCLDVLGVVVSFLPFVDQYQTSLCCRMFLKASERCDLGKAKQIRKLVKGMNEKSKILKIKELPKTYLINLMTGYDKAVGFMINSNISCEDLVCAYGVACMKLGFDFVNVLCSDYLDESRKIPNDIRVILEENGIEMRGDFYNNEYHLYRDVYVSMLLDVIKLGNPDFKWTSSGNQFNLQDGLFYYREKKKVSSNVLEEMIETRRIQSGGRINQDFKFSGLEFTKKKDENRKSNFSKLMIGGIAFDMC